MKAKKKARIATYHDASPLAWKAWSVGVPCGKCVVFVVRQPTRKRAIAMVRAALEAGGYEVES